MNQSLEIWLAGPGRTQRALARACGVREATVSAWVRGIQPRPEQMRKIAEATSGAVPVQSWFGDDLGACVPREAALAGSSRALVRVSDSDSVT